MVIAIALGRMAHDSRVLIGDIDISSVCTGVDVHAHVGSPTRVILTLSAPVEITGEPGTLELLPPEEPA